MDHGTSRYSDLERPPLGAASLTRAVTGGSGRWQEVRVVEQTGSTNADLARADDLRDGLVLVAESQTTGRGRLDRAWSSPPRAGLTFSAAVTPSWPRTAWGWVSLTAGAALTEMAREEAGLQAASLKWPNDLLVGDSKAAGILCEAVGDVVVVGVGLNVTTRRSELPVETATSLQLEGARHTDRGSLLVAFLRRFDHLLGLELPAVRERVVALCSSIGAEVSVELPNGDTVRGAGIEVDHDGRLVVETEPEHDGAQRVTQAFAAGDVRHLRRA